MKQRVAVRRLGLCHYRPVWRRMQTFTRLRRATTEDQIWLLQHHPVYTQGSSCHTPPAPGAVEIPVVHTDRGGQITYHAPGQIIAYLLLDLKRRQLGAKSLVNQIEQAVIDLLDGYAIPAARSRGAPGVYVKRAKIAALGLRIKRGCCFHGVSLNVDMDLSPYQRIDPCGYPHLAVTQMSEQLPPPGAVGISEVEDNLARRLVERFG